jgi:predicted kinase
LKQLVVFSGLPGTGKTKLAEHAAQQLGAALLSKDIIEAALWRADIRADRNSGWIAYEIVTALAEDQLRLGRSAVVDSVAGTDSIRKAWREVAARRGAQARIVECVLSDETIHRARIERRQRGIAGWPELSWDEVEKVRAHFTPWSDARLVLDAVRPLTENIEALETYLREGATTSAT